MWNDITQGGVNDINDPRNLRKDKDLKMMNDLRQRVINGLGLGLKEKSIPLDNSIGLGLGREKTDMDSVKQRVSCLKNRYMDVKKMQHRLIDLIKNPKISENAREFYFQDLCATKNEIEELEGETKLLKDAPDLDNDFKISAELQRLKELNRRTQEEIDHNNPITAPLLKEQLLKSRKREKQIRDFREAGMWVTPNTYNTLSETLHKRWKVLKDLRENAEDKISDLADRDVAIEEEIADLLEENNDDGITAGELKENKRKIKKLEREIKCI
jgi:hypothetical protein